MNSKINISITAHDAISSLGTTEESWEAYCNPNHRLTQLKTARDKIYVGAVTPGLKSKISKLKEENHNYARLDDSVLFAIWTSRNAMTKAGWKEGDSFGINIGSSRGATTLFEQYHKAFLEDGEVSSIASPTTTLGNISSWVAQDLGAQGPTLSHSITCSTALHALLNGIAWLSSGLSDKFLVGGSEAPLTPFTISQMQAMKIYSRSNDAYPCRALDLDKRSNEMVLGEGAGMICLERGITEKTIASIQGIGYATESLQHAASLSSEGVCLQRSMEMALRNEDKGSIDAIIMHAPGTLKGDQSEFRAIRAVFGSKTPALTTNKWKIGHTFGASGALSLEMAILMMQKQTFIPVPYLKEQKFPSKVNRVMVNAVGFGGNAVSILLQRAG